MIMLGFNFIMELANFQFLTEINKLKIENKLDNGNYMKKMLETSKFKI